MAQGAADVGVNRVGQDCACVTSFCTFPGPKLAQTWQPGAPAYGPVAEWGQAEGVESADENTFVDSVSF